MLGKPWGRRALPSPATSCHQRVDNTSVIPSTASPGCGFPTSCTNIFSTHRVELAAEPTRERTGSAACELLGRVGDFAALLCNGFELTSGVRRGELHDLGHRLRLNHVLRVL